MTLFFFIIIIKIGKQSLLYMVIDLTSEIWACHYNKWSLNGVKWVTLCVLGFYWDFYFKWTVKRYKSRSDERWTIKCRTMKEMMKRRWQRAKLKVSYSWSLDSHICLNMTRVILFEMLQQFNSNIVEMGAQTSSHFKFIFSTRWWCLNVI